MTRETLTAATEHTGDQGVLARICDAAIEQFDQHGFDTKFHAVAEAAGVSPARAIHQSGCKESLRKACDDYILESIRTTKSAALQSMSPASWFARLAQIESYAPITAYLVRSMLSGDELGRALMRQMIDNAEEYLEDAVRAGTIKPSGDPKARATFLAMSERPPGVATDDIAAPRICTDRRV